MKKIVSIVLVMVLLAFAVLLVVMPAGAVYPTEIPCDDGDNKLTKEELVREILRYMLEKEGAHTLDDVGDAAYVYAYWNGEPMNVEDQAVRPVTLYRPVERAITTIPEVLRIVVALGCTDRIVGVSAFVNSQYSDLLPAVYSHPELKDLPAIGSGWGEYNTEKIAQLDPDVVFLYAPYSDTADLIKTATGVPVVCVHIARDYENYEYLRLSGEVLGVEDNAEKLISYVEEEINPLKDIIAEIPDEKRPTVYLADYAYRPGFGWTTGSYYPLKVAGGINVVPEEWDYVEVSKGDVVNWSPNVILIHGGEPSIDSVLTDNALSTVDAVKNKRVYHMWGPAIGNDPARLLVDTYYIAKVLHYLEYPDKFKNLYVEDKGNQIFERFYGGENLYNIMGESLNLHHQWE